MKILSGVRGESQAKRLSASFIPKFYKFFPDVWDTAMDAIMDLCEETDAAVCESRGPSVQVKMLL